MCATNTETEGSTAEPFFHYETRCLYKLHWTFTKQEISHVSACIFVSALTDCFLHFIMLNAAFYSFAKERFIVRPARRSILGASEHVCHEKWACLASCLLCIYFNSFWWCKPQQQTTASTSILFRKFMWLYKGSIQKPLRLVWQMGAEHVSGSTQNKKREAVNTFNRLRI